MVIKGLFKSLLYFLLFFIVGAFATMLTLRLITAGRTITVPDLQGEDIVQAAAILRDAGLTLSLEGEEFHPTVPKEFIISQNPSAGSTIKERKGIGVIVSKGPREVTVPLVEGEPLWRAEIVIRQNNLAVGDIAKVHSELVDKDLVIVQNPAAGSVSDSSEGINLLVSLGPQEVGYKTPELIGKRFEEGLALTERLGIQVTKAKPLEGLIVDQRPKPGSYIRKGDRLELIVSEKDD